MQDAKGSKSHTNMPADAFHWILYLEGPIEMQISIKQGTCSYTSDNLS